MPYLNWKNSKGAVLQGGSIRAGTEVFLSGENYDALPAEFVVRRRFGALMRKHREKKDLPITEQVGNPLPITPGGEGRGEAGPLVLRTPGRRVKWRMFFEDAERNNSEELHVSRLGSVRSLGVGVSEAELKADFDLTLAVDPHVELSLLTPWDSGEANLLPFLRELADDVCATDENTDESFASLHEFLAEFLPDAPPPGWSFEIEPDEFDLGEGESDSFSIRVEAPSPGAAAFAVQMTAEIDGELAMAASDLLVVRMPEDGRTVELLGDDDLSGDNPEDLKPEQIEEPEDTRAVAAS